MSNIGSNSSTREKPCSAVARPLLARGVVEVPLAVLRVDLLAEGVGERSEGGRRVARVRILSLQLPAHEANEVPQPHSTSLCDLQEVAHCLLARARCSVLG